MWVCRWQTTDGERRLHARRGARLGKNKIRRNCRSLLEILEIGRIIRFHLTRSARANHIREREVILIVIFLCRYSRRICPSWRISIERHSYRYCIFPPLTLTLSLSLLFRSFSLFDVRDVLGILMHLSSHRPERETHNNAANALKPDRDVGLSFLYHSSKPQLRLSQSTFPTYYSLAYLPMPYFPKNNTRSVRSNFQILLYNFLERPTGLKCFFYHFFV